MTNIECGGFLFLSDFDSGNLSRVEWIPRSESAVVPVSRNGKEIVPEIPDLEFNIWTKPDCIGTEFENGNRTWFHFGIKANYTSGALVRLNLVDLNRQAKMYSQGMAPVFRMVPGRLHWERIKDKPTYTFVDNIFTLSFKFKTPENMDIITYFAFTFPYSYTDLQQSLISIDNRFLTKIGPNCFDDIYYVRECVCKSLEGRRVDLITISSYYNITGDKETRLKDLFPDSTVDRPYKFNNKKVIFLSARVHPGETPSSFVFNGILNLLLNKENPVAIVLRRMYVFKMIPFLNPDGVARGHYRTDTRGINLNRMYLNPKLEEHPSVYAARALIRYHHYGYEKEEDSLEHGVDLIRISSGSTTDNKVARQVEVLSLDEKRDLFKRNSEAWMPKWKGNTCRHCNNIVCMDQEPNNEMNSARRINSNTDICHNCSPESQCESGLFLYMDMHGHAAKKGIFMYGNHFEDVDRNIECMLLPKIMSINNHNFHFTACNFTERNMYLRDRRDGMSREGSGRVAVLKITGLVRSYTLECNYNTGRLVNVLPPTVKESTAKNIHTLPMPPKYTPLIFEEVGKALGSSILDLTGHNPLTRLPNSEFHTLRGLREWLHVNCISESGQNRIPVRTKFTSTHAQNATKSSRVKPVKSATLKTRPMSSKSKRSNSKARPPTVPVERKENLTYPAKEQNLSIQSCSHSAPNVTRVFARSTNRNKGLTLRPRSKQEKKNRPYQEPPKIQNKSSQTNIIINKLKNESIERVKMSPKRIRVSPSFRTDNSTDRLKLREICFIKENRSKKIIAKFVSSDSEKPDLHDDNDDLVVAWEPRASGHVLPRQSKVYVTSQFEKSTSEASTSSKQPPRTNSFMHTKPKRPKGSLRRLASANADSNKIDKFKKRKKLKPKVL